MLTDDRVAELFSQIENVEGGYETAITRISYLMKEVEVIWQEYRDELDKKRHPSVNIQIFWHDIHDGWRAKLEYSNGEEEIPFFTEQGCRWEHTKWKEPKHYIRMNLICWIVMLAEKWDRYVAGDLVMELVTFLREGKSFHTPAGAWNFLANMPERFSETANTWMLNKENE